MVSVKDVELDTTDSVEEAWIDVSVVCVAVILVSDCEDVSVEVGRISVELDSESWEVSEVWVVETLDSVVLVLSDRDAESVEDSLDVIVCDSGVLSDEN